MTVFNYTEGELLRISGATTRHAAIVILEGTLAHIEEPLLAEEVTELLRKLKQMTDTDFVAAGTLRPEWA